MHSLAAHRYRRIEESPVAVLEGLCRNNPLYLHARTWMSEMAAILPVTECFTTDDGWLSLPEQGLNLFLPSVRHLHSVTIDHPSRPSTALEIATHGEPRAVSFAAIPLFSDLTSFSDCLSVHPSLDLTSGEYDAWRRAHLVRPTACPCCAEAAHNRRRNLDENPLTHLLNDAIAHQRTLHCQLTSASFRFAHTFVPGDLALKQGHLTLTSADHTAMIEIDAGLCHSFTLETSRIDGEPTTLLRISNSLGETELVIATPGADVRSRWIALCESL